MSIASIVSEQKWDNASFSFEVLKPMTCDYKKNLYLEMAQIIHHHVCNCRSHGWPKSWVVNNINELDNNCLLYKSGYLSLGVSSIGIHLSVLEDLELRRGSLERIKIIVIIYFPKKEPNFLYEFMFLWNLRVSGLKW